MFNYIMKKVELPKKIPVFPLSNFIIFPKTTVPLNIFEPRYIDMINESMKSNKLIGMIQPRNLNNEQLIPKLHNIGCLGKIVSFKENESLVCKIYSAGLPNSYSIDTLKYNR